MWAESPTALPDRVRHSDALRQAVRKRVVWGWFRGRNCEGVHTFCV